MKATQLRRLDNLENQLPLLRQKRLDAAEEAAIERREKELKEARRLANRTPEEAVAEEEAAREKIKAQRGEGKEYRVYPRIRKKFEKYLDKILVKPIDIVENDFSSVCLTFFREPYCHAFDPPARDEIAKFALLEFPEDGKVTQDDLYFACESRATQAIYDEVVGARVPASERRYFFDPRNFMRVQYKWKREVPLAMLRILVNPQGTLRKRCIALARKLDRRGDLNHFDMVFDLSTNRIFGFGETIRPYLGAKEESLRYMGPRSVEEWWAAIHTASDWPISGQDPTRYYPVVTEKNKLAEMKRAKARPPRKKWA